MRNTPPAMVIAVIGWCMAAAWADDWPQFRGPDRDGVWKETGVMQTFPTEGLHIRWHASVGAGLSSPIVSGDHVYLSDSELKKPQAWERVHCYDVNSGKELWSYREEVHYPPDWAFDPKNPAGPDSTPVVAGGKVYALGKNGSLICLDALDGSPLWKRDLMADYGLAEFSGTTPSPLIEGNLLILVTGGKPDACVIALDKDSGKEVWRALDDTWTYSSPIVIDSGGKRQLIVLTPQAVTSLDPATGNIWWREKRANRGDFTAACPVFQKDLLFAGGIMFQLNPDKPAAAVLWPDAKVTFTRRVLSQTSIPLIQDGCVFSDKSYGHLVCLKALTGEPIWQSDDVTDKVNGAALQLYPNGDSTLIFTNQGNLIRAQLSAAGYKELSRVHFIEPTYLFSGRKVVWPLPAFSHRLVFARNSEELVCASLETKP